MFKTEQERNDYIEMLVRTARQSAAWLGADAQDQAEAKVRFEWSGAVGPRPDWRRATELEVARLQAERSTVNNFNLQQILYRKICDLQNELACAN